MKLSSKKGQALYKKAKKIIPGGNMLLSKRPEIFLPNAWPPYFKKAKGCYIWDIDGNKYIDMNLMGVGTNILGYSNNKVDKAVTKIIKNGSISSLNAPEEVLLAENLIDIHPWAKMVKFARTGGEANAIAIRIARAASNKDKVAFCGYHGWHDWYLATNLEKNKNLNNHLLPSLQIKGVPKDLKNSIYPFKYNNFEELEKLVNQKRIGVICMEVVRNEEPKNNFLKKVRNLATKKGIVLIFDECTSGFRSNFGGIHKIYNVEPDIALFGKALGNGYPITAIIGKKEVMEYAQDSFISSTFWTERVGPAAALATLVEMKKIKSWNTITNNGKKLIRSWEKLSQKYNLSLTTQGLPALCNFMFTSKDTNKYKTLITQEMLKKGFLASTSVYSSISHSSKILKQYFYELEKVFKLIKKCEDGENIDTYLEHPESFSTFERLN
jgi:glutamate-1-semialdehyde 2,1-aminomutase